MDIINLTTLCKDLDRFDRYYIIALKHIFLKLMNILVTIHNGKIVLYENLKYFFVVPLRLTDGDHVRANLNQRLT
jgi:hypothetical protein